MQREQDVDVKSSAEEKKHVQTKTKFKLESGDSPATLLVLLPDLHEQVQRMMGNRWVGGRQLQFSTSV